MPRFGQYETAHELSRGPFSTVSAASRSGQEGPPVFAVKVCRPPAIFSDAEATSLLEQFDRRTEVQRRAAAASAHWAPIHESGGDDGSRHAVTDLYETHAGALIGGRVRLEEPTLRRLVRRVVQGLLDLEQVARRAHGNLKPENVLLSGAGRGGDLRVGLCDPLPSARDADPGADRQRLGELVLGLVSGRRAAGAWPLEPDASWTALGRHGERWRGWCNRLLAPRGEESMDLAELAAAIDGLPPPRPRWRVPALAGGAAALTLGLAVTALLVSRGGDSEEVTADWSDASFDAWLAAMDPGTLGADSRPGWLHVLRSTGPGAARSALLQADPAWSAILNEAAGAWAEAPKLALEEALGGRLTFIYQVGEQARAPEMAVKPREFVVAVNLAARRLEEVRAAIEKLPSLAAMRAAAAAAAERGWSGSAAALEAAARGAVPDPAQPGGGPWLDAWLSGSRPAPMVALPARWNEVEAACAVFAGLAAEFGGPAGPEILALAGAAEAPADAEPLAGELERLRAGSEALRELRDCTGQSGEWPKQIHDAQLAGRVEGEAVRLRTILSSRPESMDELLRRGTEARSACAALEREYAAILDEQQRNATSIGDMIASLKSLPCSLGEDLARVFAMEKERLVQEATAHAGASGAAFTRAQARLQELTSALRARCACLVEIDGSATAPLASSDLPLPRGFDAGAAEDLRRARRRDALRSVEAAACDRPDPARTALAGLAAWEEAARTLIRRAAALEAALDAAVPFRAAWPELGSTPQGAWSELRASPAYADLAPALAALAQRVAAIDLVSAGGQDRQALAAYIDRPDPALALEAYRALQCSGAVASPGWLQDEVRLHGRMRSLLGALPESARGRVGGEIDALLARRWNCHARRAGSLADFAAAQSARATLEEAGVSFTDEPDVRALMQFLALPQVPERDLPAALRGAATAAGAAGLGAEGVRGLAQAAAALEEIERAQRDDPGGGPRPAEVGPGASPLRFRLVEAQEEFALLRFGWKDHVVAFRALPGKRRYLSTDEVTLGLFMDLVRESGAPAALSELREEHERADGPGLIQGVRAWRWDRGAMTLEPTWIRDAAPDYYAQAGPPAGPAREHPMHRLSPQAAEAVAGLMGCRLPSVEEWKAAEAAARSAPAAANLRDATWQAQQAHLKGLVDANRDNSVWLNARPRRHPWPDQDACMGLGLGREGMLQKGERALACRTESDGVLWFEPAQPSSAAWRHLIGNVAEYVREGSAYRVIGGSALGACQLMPPEAPQEPVDARKGFSDVGFRLAFDVERALEERPTIAGAFDRLVRTQAERLFTLLQQRPDAGGG